ncbi:LptE family protein [Pelodictyon luteolum]|uniref:Lipoprotein n=1 Tax=Chlorobium luteolum (strain DSM 273 / BCRC 81028 / 2530) TaxID=319225 RepID=Q3B5S9_CHLL3|nr:LptE family protein [Pelodictyon luteolum]ABB23302.1 conserved hypothetical protein [Pelodictyon luteolum DSM 273]
MLKIAVARVLFLPLLFLLLFIGGCYSLTGGSIPPHLKTVAVPVFAGGSEYRADLTRALSGKIESESSLQVVNSIARADALIEGSITSWSDTANQLSATTERAATNRITIVVQVNMDDRVEKRSVFAEQFVGFADYTTGDYLGQQRALRSCMQQIVDEAFDRIVSGW